MIERVRWDHADALALSEARRREIAKIYGRDGTEPAGSALDGPDAALFLVAYDDGRPVGCGALRVIADGVGEVKRMYVEPAARGGGAAAAILGALEAWAEQHGLHTLVLETGDLLAAAQRFYEREGYRRIPPFGPYVDSALSVCFEKHLDRFVGATLDLSERQPPSGG